MKEIKKNIIIIYMDINEKKRILITNTLREIFLFNIQKNYSELSQSIVTITNTYLLDGGKLLKVYLNFYSKDQNITEEQFLKFLNNNKKNIRFELGKKLSNKLKYVPNIDFYIDDTMKVCKEIDSLLNKIK
jgi:ribosome-binding factor A